MMGGIQPIVIAPGILCVCGERERQTEYIHIGYLCIYVYISEKD